MKYLLLIASSLIFFSCRSVHEPSATSFSEMGQYKGVVSHKYRAQGCKTVIMVMGSNGIIERVIIPVNELENKFDKNNLKITFDYLPLKIKQPEGCSDGIPAEISNISTIKD